MLTKAFLLAVSTLGLVGTGVRAEESMAPHKTISDAELTTCLEEARAISFHEAMVAATVACRGLHVGMDVLGGIRSLGMGEAMEENPVANGDMMMRGDAMMGGDAMAPKQ